LKKLIKVIISIKTITREVYIVKIEKPYKYDVIVKEYGCAIIWCIGSHVLNGNTYLSMCGVFTLNL